MPTTAHTGTVASAASGTTRTKSNPNFVSSTQAAHAPMPANVPGISETCPVQPVRTTSDSESSAMRVARVVTNAQKSDMGTVASARAAPPASQFRPVPRSGMRTPLVKSRSSPWTARASWSETKKRSTRITSRTSTSAGAMTLRSPSMGAGKPTRTSWAMPMPTPPSSAAGRLTNPPRSAAASALSWKPFRARGLIGPNGMIRIAARAALLPASAHTIASVRPTLMPARRAAVGFWAMARTWMPNSLRWINAVRAMARESPATITPSRW